MSVADLDAAIIGAGPYGLSIAAHLRALGISFAIFGEPMLSWRNHMPSGMFLKSEGFASSLYDPKGSFTLRHYCAERGLPYRDIGLPVPVEKLGEIHNEDLRGRLGVGRQRRQGDGGGGD